MFSKEGKSCYAEVHSRKTIVDIAVLTQQLNKLWNDINNTDINNFTKDRNNIKKSIENVEKDLNELKRLFKIVK